jgi:hypothetical protein
MFVLRSAFWLIVGFLLVAPHGTDFRAAATTLKDSAVEAGIKAGEDLIVSQITTTHRLPDLLISVAKTSLDATFLAPTVVAVLPRPRPAALS